MVVVGVNQVQGALRWYIDNFSAIADWRATLARVTHFRQGVLRVDHLDEAIEQRIELVPSREEKLSLMRCCSRLARCLGDDEASLGYRRLRNNREVELGQARRFPLARKMTLTMLSNYVVTSSYGKAH